MENMVGNIFRRAEGSGELGKRMEGGWRFALETITSFCG